MPPGGRFWHAVTDSNSVLFTWQDVFAGRDTNSPVSFQAELFWNGDFTYRYAFPSNSSILNPNSSFTNFVIGAQHNGGGETYALNDTNLLFNGLELRWRAFGILDPGIDDHDGDGLSTYDEVMKYGTDPRLPDSDFDGLGDKQEVETPGLNALRRDSHGYGMPDGSNPQSLPWSISDGNANGLPDDWEAYWFGTNGTSGAYADDNHDGFSNLANLLTGTDPAKAPPPGFAVTNGVPVAGIDAWEIAPAFALEMQSGLTNILTREIQAGRTSPWQQFFVSSKPSAAGAWSLDGLELSWEDGTNVSGAATASPSGDSLRLGLSSCLFEKLTVRLAPSRTSGLVRSPAPLYLVRWTPQPAFTPSVTVAAATSSNGVPCVAAVLEAGGAAALPFTIATSARPHKAPPAQDETGERAQPPDPGSAVTPVFTSGQTSGYLTAPYPSEAALPAPCGSAPIRVLLYKIEIVSTGGTALTRPFGQLSPPYPLDTAALRSKWLNNAVATDSADSPGFTVSTGLNSEFLRIRINGEETGSFMWPESSAAPRAGLAAMGAAASLRASSLCAGGCVGAGVECLLCASNIVDQCVERDPDDYTKDDDPPGGDGEKDKPTCACGDPEGGAFNSVDFRIPLGTPGPGRISGFLWFSMATPQTVTPGIFNVLGDPTVIVETNDYGVITVTCTAPNGRSLTISGMTGGACVRVYDSHGAYVHRWEISNPGGVYSDTVQLVKFDQADNPVSDSTYFYHGGGGYWSRVDGLDGATETLDITGDLDAYGWRNEERMLISGGVTLSGTLTCRQVIGAGSAAVSRVTRLDTWDGFTGRWLSRQSLYWKDNLNAQRNGSLKLRFGDGIPWAYSACDIRGRETLGAGPLDGSAYFPGMTNRDDILTPGDLAALPGFACAAKAYGYAPDAVAGDSADYSDSRSPRETVSYVIRNGTATVTAREWHVYTRTHGADGSVTVRTIRAASAAAAIDDGGNAVSYTSAYAGSCLLYTSDAADE